MKVAFLTPMKPPDHPVPSGDRTFARLILAALSLGGHTVTLPSALSTRVDQPEQFGAIEREAASETARIASSWRQHGVPEVLLTYHSYHRAPDLIGPALAVAFDLPYAIIEASRASRHASGVWAQGFAMAEIALARADAVGAVTDRDAAGLVALGPRVTRLPPFLDTAPFSAPARPRPGALVSAAMMRDGRKARSVALLADAFALIRTGAVEATLAIAGDGPVRNSLEPLFPAGTLVGALDQPALAALFSTAAIFVWPAIAEPFGFVFLEAQAAGLPVVGGNAAGVTDVVADGETGILVAEGDAPALAAAVLTLLADPARRARMAHAARAFASGHDLNAGSRRLDALFSRAIAHRRATAA